MCYAFLETSMPSDQIMRFKLLRYDVMILIKNVRPMNLNDHGVCVSGKYGSVCHE